jgi:hypothetical protein
VITAQPGDRSWISSLRSARWPIAGGFGSAQCPATAWRRRHEGQWGSKPRPCNAGH